MGNGASPIRVLIADEQPLFRDGLRLRIEEEPSFRVVGQTGELHETVQLTQRCKPDVVLLDLGLAGRSGLQALGLIQALPLPVRTLMLASTVDKFLVLDVLRRGASGILLKESSAQLLRKSIQSVVAGEYWIGRRSVGDLVQELKKYSLPVTEKKSTRGWRLTPRQVQIVAEIISGKTNKEIALTLGLSDQTVKHHLTTIFNELGVFNRLELALFAVHHNVEFRFSNR